MSKLERKLRRWVWRHWFKWERGFLQAIVDSEPPFEYPVGEKRLAVLFLHLVEGGHE